MKKVIFLSLLGVFSIFSAFSQVVLNEDFSAGTLPPGWSQSSVSAGDSWAFGGGVDFGSTSTIPDASGNSGQYARIDMSLDPDTTALITPRVSIAGMTTPRLTFYYITQTTSTSFSPYNRLIVDYWNGSSWVNITVIDTLTTLGWTQYSFNIATYAFNTDTVQFRFAAQEGGAAIGGTGSFTYDQDLALDQVVVEETPSCLIPNALMASNITSSSADLAWTENNSATSWEIEYGSAGFTPGNGTSALVSTNPYSVTGLSSNSSFDWYVRSICAPGDTSAWAGPNNFLTPCAAFAAPFTEDFNTFVPSCWDEADNGDLTTGPTSLGSGLWAAGGSGTRINLYTTSRSEWIVSPTIDFGAGGYELAIDVLGYDWGSSPGTFSGMGSDDSVVVAISSNGGAWVPVYTWDASNPPASTSTTYSINLTTYTGSNHVIGIWAKDGPTNDIEDYYFEVDRFELRVPPSCAAPSFLGNRNLAATGADLYWTENGSATQWEVEYGAAGFTQGTGTSTIVNTDTFTTITGLTAETSYDWYVRAICGPADTSSWAGANSFLTPCAVKSTPFLDDVESHTPVNGFTLSQCWTASWQSTSNDWNIDGGGSTPSTGTGPSGPYSGSNYFYFEASGGATGNEAILTSPDIDVTSLTAPMIEFYYHMFGDNRGVMGDLFIDYFDGTNYVVVDSIKGEQQATQAAPWLRRRVPIPSATGTINVRFRAYRGTGSQYGDIAIDDIAVKETPSCLAPTMLGSANTTATSNVAFWTESGTATQWEVEYGAAGYTVGSGTSTIVNTDTFLTITGLTSNTNYDWNVRAICGAGDTSGWSGPNSFLTLCNPYTAPYSQNFDGTSDPNIDACWSVINATNSTGAWVQTENSTADPQRSAPNSIELYNSGASTGNLLLISPQFTDLDSNKQVTFWLQNEGSTAYTSDLIVGTMSDPTQDTTFEAFVTIPNSAFASANWVEFIIPFTGLSNGDQYVAFKHGLNSTFDYIFMDDFSYEVQPSCPKPTFLASNSLDANNTEISWTENGGATQWEVEWDTAGTAFGSGNRFITSTNPDTLTGLSPLSSYVYYVRSICGANDTSAWSAAYNFSTPIQGPRVINCTVGNPSTVFSDDFETQQWTGNIGTGSTTRNWNYRSGTTTSGSTGPSGAHSGTQYFYYEASSGTPTTASAVSPAIDLSSALGSAELSFWMHAYGQSMGTFEVKVGTSATGPFTSLFTWNQELQTSEAAPYQQVGVNLDAYLGSTIYVELFYTQGSSFYGDLAVDLMEVNTCTQCAAPSNLSASNVGLNSADLAWTENGTATNWEIEYGPIGFTPGSGTTVVATTNPYTLTGINPSTGYDFYVRSICGVNDTSTYSPSSSFSTLNGVPYTQTFDAFNNGTTISDEGWSNTGPGTNPQWQIGTSTGSSGTGPNADHTTGSGKFAFLETSSPSSLGDTDTLISAPIITGPGDSVLSMNFWYHMHGASMGNLEAWIVSANNNPIQLTTIVGQQQVNQGDPWLESKSVFTGYQNDTIYMVFVGVAGSSFTSDMAVDDASITTPPPNDLGVTAINSPVTGCGLGSADTVNVTVSNFGGVAQSGFTLTYELNGVAATAGTFSGTLAPGASATYSFPTTANLSAGGVYTIAAYTSLSGDADATNDRSSVSVRNIPAANVPYAESFENGAAGWFVDGISSFALGAPSGSVITSASDGTQAWVTNLSGNYNNGESGSVNSPCFDLSNIANPWIELDIWYDIETGWDGAIMEASTDGGATWNTVGALNDPVNWYNNTVNVLGGAGAWNGNGASGSGGWITARHALDSLAGLSSVRLRVSFVSDGSVTNEGMAFDDVRVYDSIPYYPIATINTEDTITGVADSLNVYCWTSGTVIGVDLDGNNGISFYISDLSSGSQEGINVFNFNDVSGYVVNEGDSIRVRGDIIQFNGLTEINPDSIEIISTNATLPTPLPVTSLDESTEAKWLSLNDDFVLLDPSGSFSYNMDATNGTDTITIRVDADTDVSDSLRISTNALVAGDTICGMLGVGGQFDNSSPYTSGYQIFPMFYSDVTICRNTVGIEDKKQAVNTIDIYPNPTEGQFTIRTSGLSDDNAMVRVRDISGKVILEENIAQSNQAFTRTYDLNGQAKGMYFISIIDGEQARVFKLIVQ